LISIPGLGRRDWYLKQTTCGDRHHVVVKSWKYVRERGESWVAMNELG
jgi:hypothetical protein